MKDYLHNMVQHDTDTTYIHNTMYINVEYSILKQNKKKE